MSFAGLLNQTATISSNLGPKGRHGERAFTNTREVRIRFEQDNRVMRTAENEREPIDGTVFIGPGQGIATGDKMTIAGTDYRVMAIKSVVAAAGKVHHQEIMVQNWSYKA